jgi:hypothetical protein
MAMEETAMHENDLATAREHKVRPPRKVLAMKPVAVAKSVHDPTHDPFRSRVLAPDAGHAFASCFGREGVGHDERLWRSASRCKWVVASPVS